MSEIADRLRNAAREIRAAGINGWGNACEDGADEIERLVAHVGLLGGQLDYFLKSQGIRAADREDASHG
jgi:hypothetical protein